MELQRINQNLEIKTKFNILSSCRQFEGLFWSTATGLLHALQATLIKDLNELKAAELAVYMGISQAMFCLPLFFLKVQNIKLESYFFKYLFINSITKAMFSLGRSASFQMLPLGDASAIVFSSPVFTAIFARIFIKEHISRLCIISLLLSMVGLSLTVKLPLILSSSDFTQRAGTVHHLIGCGFAFLAVVGSAANAITVRILKPVPLETTLCIQGVMVGVMSSALSPVFDGFHHPTCSASYLLIIVCIVNFLTGFVYIRALKAEEATYVTICSRTVEIAAAFFIQVLFFRQSIDAYSASGGIIIALSGILVPFQRWVEGNPEGSRWRIEWFLR